MTDIEVVFVSEGECDLCGEEGAYMIDGERELYCARCLNANIPMRELLEEAKDDV
jgi:hypothetical protein